VTGARPGPPGAGPGSDDGRAQRRRSLGIGLLLAGAAAILVAAVLPGRLSPLAPLVNDWIPSLDHRDVLVVAHLLGYGLAVPIAAAVIGRIGRAVLVVGALSLLVEGVQAFVPWRTADWADVGWNAVALGLGAALALAVRAFVRRRRRATRAHFSGRGSPRAPPPPGGSTGSGPRPGSP
jgi:hypothetical protein